MTAPLSITNSDGGSVEMRREPASDTEPDLSVTPSSTIWAATFSGVDWDAALLALICAGLALGALAIYKIADAIASVCWACG